jgi:ribose/xylose/arabinose/galactoside ABC-type transport system permease subunit
MTTATDTPRTGAPWHFWLVAVISVLWNSYGGYDYAMSQLKGDAYYQQMHMTEAQIAYMHAYPVWMVAVWAIGVWGAVLGSLLLLLRSRYAVPAFVASLAGFLVSLVYTYLLSDGSKVMGQSGMIMQLVILAGCLFFLWYAQLMAKRGVLR